MATARELIKFLTKRGCGSHLILQHPETGYKAVIPIHPGDLPKGLFIKILHDAGFSLEDYLAQRRRKG